MDVCPSALSIDVVNVLHIAIKSRWSGAFCRVGSLPVLFVMCRRQPSLLGWG